MMRLIFIILVLAATPAHAQISAARCLSVECNSIQVTIGAGELSIPAVPSNRHYQDLLAWIAKGGVIEPYVAPPAPEPPRDLAAEFDALQAAIVKKGVVTEQEIEAEKPKVDDSKEGQIEP